MALEEREIEAAALGLEFQSRARLAAKLLASLDETSDENTAQLWIEEAERRDAAMDAGEEAGRSLEEVLEAARRRLK